MNSKTHSRNEAYVWIWLPDSVAPVVAGRISKNADQYQFNYGQSYLALQNAIPIYTRELPLKAGLISPLGDLTIAGCLRDGSPDAWGRRVVINRLSNAPESTVEIDETDEILFMLSSGSNRMGAIDFQESPINYTPRIEDKATLDELINSVDRVEAGIPLTPQLDNALFHGSSMGGARPKSNIQDDEKQYIAKFSSSSDTTPVVKAEYIAMKLAAEVGLNVAPVHLLQIAGRDILLVERFDRIKSSRGWQRRSMVSALTIFELDEMMARYASYEHLAEAIRINFTNPKSTLTELFSRLVFNVLTGNTDDHARNHAAFWDGEQLTLTPAYDICPQNRTGREASQAMKILGDRNLSRIDLCLESAALYALSSDNALAIVKHQISVIRDKWEAICDAAKLDQTSRNFYWGRQFLNPFSIEGFEKF